MMKRTHSVKMMRCMIDTKLDRFSNLVKRCVGMANRYRDTALDQHLNGFGLRPFSSGARVTKRIVLPEASI